MLLAEARRGVSHLPGERRGLNRRFVRSPPCSAKAPMSLQHDSLGGSRAVLHRRNPKPPSPAPMAQQAKHTGQSWPLHRGQDAALALVQI